MKELYKPEDISIMLLMVCEDIISYVPDNDLSPARPEVVEKMNQAKELLSEFQLESAIVFGRAGEEILRCAKKEKIDMIIMTKSTKRGWVQAIGSVTTYVVKYAPCMVMIAPEV